MLQKSALDKLIPIFRKDARRTLRMRVPGFPAPYYCSFLLRDNDSFNTWASSGSTCAKKSEQSRTVFCDIRVGSYRYDQSQQGGLSWNEEDLESTKYATVPIDDSNLDGLRMALWRLSEIKFREALSDYSHKEALRISTIDPNRKFASFTKLSSKKFVQKNNLEKVDSARWVKFCKTASQWMSEFPNVFGNSVEYTSNLETSLFVNTERRVVVQNHQLFTLSATFKKLTKEGSHLEQNLVLNTVSQSELPDLRKFKSLIRAKYAQLMELTKAGRVHAFSGPVLLYPQPAGLLFHEAIGHRLEGSRMLSTGEGQTFKGQIGRRIFNVDINIRDNPRQKHFDGKKCIGAYDFDSEGTEGQNVLLIENGILKNFLNTRAATSRRLFSPNGHARNSSYQQPISRMAVTMVDAKKKVPMERLKELLVREINRQNKPFGMIVYETSAGETDTSTYNFQAFYGEITYATLVYPDGKEECIHGVNFVGTPLQALNNIIAVGDERYLDNNFCGAESGFIPVSMISPAILLKNLELQAKDEELVTQYILPKPKLRR